MTRNGLITTLLIIGACLVPEHAQAGTHAKAPKPVIHRELPPVGPFPDAPCNEDSRMDIYLAPDGTLWECVCEALATEHACDWYEQGSWKTSKMRRRFTIRTPLRAGYWSTR